MQNNEVALCTTKNWECGDCVKKILKSEYQPPKQEKWVVHRTLRKQSREVYIGVDDKDLARVWEKAWGTAMPTTYKEECAYRHCFMDAISVRDELNKARVGKQTYG